MTRQVMVVLVATWCVTAPQAWSQWRWQGGDAEPESGQVKAADQGQQSPKRMEDVVYLTDGSVLRGTIIEYRPDQGVKIQLAGGSILVAGYERIVKEPQVGAPADNEGTAPSAAAQSGQFAQGETYTQGLADGTGSAENKYGSGGWFAGGLATGFVGGLLGTGCLWGVSQSGSIDLPAVDAQAIAAKSQEYQSGYREGYSKKARKKRSASTAVGGVLGTAAFLVIILPTLLEG